MIQPAEILFLLRTAKVVDRLMCLLIYVIFPVIRTACRCNSRVSDGNVHMPIIRVQGDSDVLVAVLISWMFLKIGFNYILIIGDCSDFRVSGFLQDAMLKLKSTASHEFLLINRCPGRNGINRLVFIRVFCTGKVVTKHTFNIWCILVD
ncbi:hypothetical protein D3C71_1174340 [compost metagenome]